MADIVTGKFIKTRRKNADIPGEILCIRAGIDRARLTKIELGYIRASDEELQRLACALDELIETKNRINEFSTASGWPVPAI